MVYRILLTSEVQRFLEKQDAPIRNRILEKFEHLKNNPQLEKALTASLAGLWSLRIGDYRAIYRIEQMELIVLVVRVGHRKNVY